jgi:hypothetical protein
MKHKMSLLNNVSKIFLYVILTVIATSCNIINPDEKAPGYIEVNKFSFDPNPTIGVTGPSTSTNIKDVWLYIDNDFQGAYELPARIPVLETGSRRIILSPGIFLNGIASTRSPYPFYRGDIRNVEIPENGTITVDPITSYFDSVKVSYFEAFEGAGFSLGSTPVSDTTMYQVPAGDPNVFEGSGSGVVYLDTARTQFEVISTSEYDLPGAGAAVFLEFDYKVNQNMKVGLYIDIPGVGIQQVPIYTVNPTATWKKIYIQLGYTVSAYGGANWYKIYFGAIKDSDVEKPVFYLDNIKIVHF